MPEYLIILIILFLIAFYFQRKYKLHIFKNKKQAIHVIINCFFMETLWDYIAIQRHHWIYPGNGLIGVKLLGIPFEDFLFFLIVPYCILIIFRYHEKEDKN